MLLFLVFLAFQILWVVDDDGSQIEMEICTTSGLALCHVFFLEPFAGSRQSIAFGIRMDWACQGHLLSEESIFKVISESK